jgi:hypothetical protein
VRPCYDVDGQTTTEFADGALLMAATGAIIGVLGWHVVRSCSISHESYTRRSSVFVNGSIRICAPALG